MEHISEAIKERNIILETNDPVAAEVFTAVPNFILKNPKLSVGENLTYAMFISHAWHNDQCFPGQERLAEDMGAGVRSMNRFIKGLEAKGFITIQRRGLGKTNLYTLHFQVKKKSSSR
jgi:hypothetical protein